MNTIHGALVVCLNIGVDPPDIHKPDPCARLEAWHKPNPEHAIKSLHAIGDTLRAQYERWFHPKVKPDFRLALDPTVSVLRRTCSSLRRSAKQDRILFHYNGHGVPLPTANGEVWVFNQGYSQYIPLNLFDLHEVLSSPTLYIFDCNSAGTVLQYFRKMNEQLEREWNEAQQASSATPSSNPPLHRHSILLAACRPGQLLPQSPHMPADLFTSCLTTPVRTALRWFACRTLALHITVEMVDRIPGDVNNRNTPLGELDYILTAITDTIAWTSLPRHLFVKFYRQDVLLAGLMRNFLLAQRIMGTFGCSPVSYPVLPDTHNHPLWQSFDIAMENIFTQLPSILAEHDARVRASQLHADIKPEFRVSPQSSVPDQPLRPHSDNPNSLRSQPNNPASQNLGVVSYRRSTFFEDHLKAFGVWLDMGLDGRNPPDQLPIMLQVLLGPACRVGALSLISRYMQTGPTAVDHALSVGVFPYIMRFLDKERLGTPEERKSIRNDLMFVWSKILAFDESCHADIVKYNVDAFFVSYLYDATDDIEPIYLACALFVLSNVAHQNADRCYAIHTLDVCQPLLSHPHPLVRRWVCLCLTEILSRCNPQTQAHMLSLTRLLDVLCTMSRLDLAADVRAAAVSTIAAIMNSVLKQSPMVSNSIHNPNYVPTAGTAHVQSSRTESPTSTAMLPPPVPRQGSSPTDIEFEKIPSGSAVGQPMFDLAPSLCSEHERRALIVLGTKLAAIAHWESSVLVRREVAFAIAKTVEIRQERFVRAALDAEICTFTSADRNIIENVERCEDVYSALWNSLSELAFDSHPVIAAVARKSYDIVCDIVSKGGGDLNLPGTSAPIDIDASNGVHNLALREHKSDVLVTSLMTSDLDNSISPHLDLASSEGESSQLPSSDPGTARAGPLPNDDKGSRTGPSETSVHGRNEEMARISRLEMLAERTAVRGVHVRSASGSFDLGVSRQSKYSTIVSAESYPTDRHRPALLVESTPGLDEERKLVHRSEKVTGKVSDKSDVHGEERPRSLPHVALMNGFGNLVRTVSQQFLLNTATGARMAISSGTDIPRLTDRAVVSQHSGDRPEARLKILGNGKFRERGRFSENISFSPPRPPRRSLSYQVLNEPAIFSPTKDAPRMSDGRRTSYASLSKLVSEDDVSRPMNRPFSQEYNRVMLSSTGSAALSLYEWSCAYMSRAKVESNILDYSHEEENFARYATLWSVINKRFGSGGSRAERLRAFALLGKGDDVLGMEGGEEDFAGDVGKKEFAHARELTFYEMAAGGGSITAVVFLPRDTGIGDDQLVATGDSNGSVGVYDARTGKCQGAFGIPVSPGAPEAGVSSLLCLNPHGTDNPSGRSLSNSHTALILAGAYDGRVAVFRSDFVGPNYRIVSTFQACGRTGPCRTVCSRVPSRAPSRGGSEVDVGRESDVADLWRRTGLQLGFNVNSARLAAGGCDGEVVRIWDLVTEQCMWEGPVVARGVIPTSITMWKSGNHNVFVVGASNGGVYVADMREKAVSGTPCGFLLGRHRESIMSVGTRPPHEAVCDWETIVSADRSGEVVIWDPRWRGTEWHVRDLSYGKSDERRIGAHNSDLAAMSVHRTGRYIATGSSNCVKIFGEERAMVKMITHHDLSCSVACGPGMRCQGRLDPVSSLAFQHETSLLAVGSFSGSVMLYGRHRDLFPGIE